MACASCGRSIGTQQFSQNITIKAPSEQTVASCETTLESLAELNRKLECFIKSALFVNCTKQEVHVVQGYVQSMINLQQPCKYDISSFITRTENVDCPYNI